MSPRQNIISAIKVMKGRVSKKDDKEQNDEQEGFSYSFTNKKKINFFFEVYVRVRIRTENLEVSTEIRIEF